MSNNTLSRSLHDVGLAAWFGGSLMGAIGLNGGAATAENPKQRTDIASAGWAKWAPVNAGAIALHLIGGAGIVRDNRGRIDHQQGVAATTIIKTVVTGAAMGATAYSAVVGKKISDYSDAPSKGVTEPGSGTPEGLAEAQRQERLLQWSLPALTGVLVILSAYMGEQQRTTSVASGLANRARRVVNS